MNRRMINVDFFPYHDFIYMIKNHPEFSKDRISELASLIYPEGGKDALEMVRRVEAGETLLL